MKNGRIGRVDYSDLKNPPEKHERSTALFFAKRGKYVEFIRPHSIKGSHNPDFLMDGKIWEIKSPTTYSDSSFEYNFRKAIKQSNNIIFDLRRLSMLNEKKYINELKKRCHTPTIKTLILVTKDGKVLTLRGKIDIL
ncbi:hypothetical protein IKF28_03005 [Candidatus Saccharibacteria bacterium]|nr:hypothetical protein [Candidatus Saccharibacteria bacterium]